MSKMRIVILGLAAGSAVMAGLLAKGFVGVKPEAEKIEVNTVKTTDVLVASRDILLGDRLIDGATEWRAWPDDNVTDAMITKAEKSDAREVFVTARARTMFFAGETIIERKLVLPGETGFMSALLPKGMRAISVAISERSSAGGFILPNDRVDVILTRKINDTVSAETVLSNVKVLAINQTYRQEKEGDAPTIAEGKTATLELDPRQTEVIALIESSGELSLALRSMAENEGSDASKLGPQLSDNYTGKKAGTNEMLYVRYGIEVYTSNP